MNAYDILLERGFIKQVSHPEIRDILGGAIRYVLYRL